MSRLGVKACYLSEQDDDEIKDSVVKGLYQLVYFTPELLLTNKKWRNMLISEVYAKRLKAFVVDEAHTVVEW